MKMGTRLWEPDWGGKLPTMPFLEREWVPFLTCWRIAGIESVTEELAPKLWDAGAATTLPMPATRKSKSRCVMNDCMATVKREFEDGICLWGYVSCKQSVFKYLWTTGCGVSPLLEDLSRRKPSFLPYYFIRRILPNPPQIWWDRLSD